MEEWRKTSILAEFLLRSVTIRLNLLELQVEQEDHHSFLSSHSLRIEEEEEEGRRSISCKVTCKVDLHESTGSGGCESGERGKRKPGGWTKAPNENWRRRRGLAEAVVREGAAAGVKIIISATMRRGRAAGAAREERK